jgi:hypothetical protein
MTTFGQLAVATNRRSKTTALTRSASRAMWLLGFFPLVRMTDIGEVGFLVDLTTISKVAPVVRSALIVR